MNKTINNITQVMSDIYGLDISKHDEIFLQKTVEKRVDATGIKTAFDYVVFLSKDNQEAISLFSALNNTYTEFFRSSLSFAVLEQSILPLLIESKSDNRELRVWSAGCSSGQEPYSIAMLLERIQATHKKSFRYRIIATDISESELLVAKKGEYHKEALSNIKVKDLKEFFIQSGETYTVCPNLKNHVHFSNYDLLDSLSACPQESVFGDFDIVFCSNVIFYYKPEYQRSIINKLIGAMASRGYLVVGETERHNIEKSGALPAVAPLSPIFQKRI